MSRYSIVESVGTKRQDVHTFEDIERHHPTRGVESGRVYGDVAGEREELLGNYRGTAQVSGHGSYYLSKDFILSDGVSRAVVVPSVANGYIGKIDARDGILQIYDKPASDPSREMIAQYRHLYLRGSKLEVGQAIEYGAPLAPQGGFNKGNPRAFGAHVHLDINANYLPQAQRYISDIDSGAITTEARLPRSENLTAEVAVTNVASRGSSRLAAGGAPAMADGVLKLGETNDDAIKQLQDRLNALGVTDASGKPLVPDRDFGQRTKEAVQAFQRSQGIEDDGKAGPKTFEALDKAEAAQREAGARSDGTVAPSAAPLLSDPRHAEHAMYRQAANGLGKFGGLTGQELDRAAASLVVESRQAGLTQIDHVVSNGSRLFAVQGGLSDPTHQRAFVDREPALNQSVEQATQRLLQQAPEMQPPVHAQQQVHVQQPRVQGM